LKGRLPSDRLLAIDASQQLTAVVGAPPVEPRLSIDLPVPGP
jgi:hypothetical protein